MTLSPEKDLGLDTERTKIEEKMSSVTSRV